MEGIYKISQCILVTNWPIKIQENQNFMNPALKNLQKLLHFEIIHFSITEMQSVKLYLLPLDSQKHMQLKIWQTDLHWYLHSLNSFFFHIKFNWTIVWTPGFVTVIAVELRFNLHPNISPSKTNGKNSDKLLLIWTCLNCAILSLPCLL